MWLGTLILGRAPESMHDFLAAYVRYATHVEAYLFLAANPYPGFFLGSAAAYPVDVEIDPPARQSRWKTLLRGVLAIPALIVLLAFWGGGGGGGRGGGYGLGIGGTSGVASFLTWFAALARGRAPHGLRDVIAWGLGYSAQATGYLFLLTDRYPYSGPEGHVSLDRPPGAEGRPRLAVTDDLRRSRLTVFFRLPLSVPHLVWWAGWTILALVAAVLNWLAALLLGRSPRPLARFLAAYVRYSTHVFAFLTLVGNPFPGFVGRAGSYPVDVVLDPFGAQHRLVTLFRLVLSVPALLLASAATGILPVVAFLGWFAALVQGRMPGGLQSSGAWALGYSAQTNAYLSMLTDRYPHSAPGAVLELGPDPPSDGAPAALR